MIHDIRSAIWEPVKFWEAKTYIMTTDPVKKFEDNFFLLKRIKTYSFERGILAVTLMVNWKIPARLDNLVGGINIAW